MPSPSEVARDHYRRQALIARAASAAVEALWRQVDQADLDGSFAALGPRMVERVALGQYAAAAASGKYLSDILAAQGVTADPLAALDPRAFAGTAADGGDLLSLLSGSIIRAKALIAGGVAPAEAMRSGGARAVLMAANETQQAGVSADGAAAALDRKVGGYRRMLVQPSCSRCVVLAGKWFRWNEGFLRHPRCDCRHAPAAEAGDLSDMTVNPTAYFDSLTAAEQDRTFGKADAEAIRSGADIGRVVNARQSTTVPTGRRTARGTPTTATVEDCLRRGNGDRDATVRALRAAGYLRT